MGLVNPSFEGVSGPGGWTRKTHTGQEFGEVYVPEGWVAWWAEGLYRRPEMKVIPKQAPFLDPLRIAEGSWGLQSFTYYGRQNAGLYQVVEGLTPGATYSFDALAHAWSNHRDPNLYWCWNCGNAVKVPGGEDHAACSKCGTGINRKCKLVYAHAGDARWSEGAGYDFVRWDPDEIPPLSANPVNDAKGNFLFQVGVSFGEPDPFSDEVQWSRGAHIYNGFFNVPAVRFTAPTNGRAVVYLKASSLWPFQTSDAYWDDCRLDVVEEPLTRGKPRVQYKSTVNVIPEGATDERAAEIFLTGWRRSREMAGGSYDQAGIGDLDKRIANLWDIRAADRQAFIDFYATYYPGVDVVFCGEGDLTIWDRDISSELATCSTFTHATLKAQNGWWQRTLGQIKGVTIHHTLSDSPHATAKVCIAKYGGLPSIQYHIWITQTGEVLLCEPLESGLWHDNTGNQNVNISVGMAGRLHEYRPSDAQLDAAVKVAAWAVRHPEMDVTLERVKGHRDYAQTECPGWHTGWKADFYGRLQALLGEDPPTPPTPPTPPQPPTPPAGSNWTLRSFHVQANRAGLPEYVQRKKAEGKPLRAIKFCHCAGEARWLKEVSPETLVIYRKVYNNWKDFIYYPDHLGGLDEAVNRLIAWQMPEIQELYNIHQGKPFIVEDLNETVACGAVEDIRRVGLFAAKYARKLHSLNLGAVACVANVAVGNPEHGPEMELLLSPLKAVHDDGIPFYLGYHSYFPVIGTEEWLERDWIHYAGRFIRYDEIAQKLGMKLQFALTECGPIGGTIVWHKAMQKNIPSLNAGAGWRSPLCINGDLARYVKLMDRFDKLVFDSVPGREGRVLTATAFTVSGGSEWRWFEHNRAEFEAL
jgi:hypothetical protein